METKRLHDLRCSVTIPTMPLLAWFRVTCVLGMLLLAFFLSHYLGVSGAHTVASVPLLFLTAIATITSSSPAFVAAACAVGLCLSHDGGATWKLLAEGLDGTTLLAVAVVGDEALFSIQDGPFASRSQIWRWRNGSERVEPVRDGLPEWLEGKVDTDTSPREPDAL
jgi:hypothetical protein